MREVAVMSLSGDSGRITVTLPIWIVGELRREAVSETQHHQSDREDMFVKHNGTAGNVYQAHHHGKWNPRSSAYGRFWIDVPSGERKRRTVSLGL